MTKFNVNVASDVYSQRENLKFCFESRPTLAQLINTTESEFDIRGRGHRPVGYPDIPFHVQTFQLYDAVLMRWVDLYSPSQLTPNCQVFAFQPESVWTPHREGGSIPTAVRTMTWESSAKAPQRLPTERNFPPSTLEKTRAVFSELDTMNKGYVLCAELRNALRRDGIEFTSNTVGELFDRADADHDGHITYPEWVKFAKRYPNLVDAIYYRELDASAAAHPLHNNTEHTKVVVQAQHARSHSLEELYGELREEQRKAERAFDEARNEVVRTKGIYDAAVVAEREARNNLFYAA
jgi:hypothetical protein